MQKRVALARAIASDPEIMFFDEPTTGLDPIMADVINNLIIKTTREMGATALSITHDMASARKIAHRIAMLYQGQIIWAGPVAQIDRSGDRAGRAIHQRPRRGADPDGHTGVTGRLAHAGAESAVSDLRHALAPTLSSRMERERAQRAARVKRASVFKYIEG